MIAKEKFKKAMKIFGILILAIFIMFIISTSVIALYTPKNIDIDNFINVVYVSKNLKNTIKFVDRENLIFITGKKAQIYKITDIEQDIILIKDAEQYFAIKLIDNSKIYCSKTKQYMYLQEEKNEN